MNILLADDHDLVRDAIGALLQNDDESIQVDTVENLPKVLEKLRQGQSYDVIILDLKISLSFSLSKEIILTPWFISVNFILMP